MKRFYYNDFILFNDSCVYINLNDYESPEEFASCMLDFLCDFSKERWDDAQDCQVFSLEFANGLYKIHLPFLYPYTDVNSNIYLGQIYETYFNTLEVNNIYMYINEIN